ncbi:hypothetical protein OBP_212 [Pseudomonas phage OBP]|uniref:hypothetical protein n=1 Tax=Pseudomonas phage OBP TaxID=1124849 RepID=UPI000240D5B8|nr:hypothetical protein OBP_212 [Pseudomonas phage OBP]AEV89649.1 hypothetical protein OBP_212 [Pseudomonas phage OBP]
MSNFIKNVIANIFFILGLIIAGILGLFLAAFKVIVIAANCYWKTVYTISSFMLEHFGAIFSVIIIGVFGYAILSPRDPNFISQDDPRHPCNNEL